MLSSPKIRLILKPPKPSTTTTSSKRLSPQLPLMLNQSPPTRTRESAREKRSSLPFRAKSELELELQLLSLPVEMVGMFVGRPQRKKPRLNSRPSTRASSNRLGSKSPLARRVKGWSSGRTVNLRSSRRRRRRRLL